jgi:hypothetical protein
MRQRMPAALTLTNTLASEHEARANSERVGMEREVGFFFFFCFV